VVTFQSIAWLKARIGYFAGLDFSHTVSSGGEVSISPSRDSCDEVGLAVVPPAARIACSNVMPG